MADWTVRAEATADPRVIRVAAGRDGRPATAAEVVAGWRDDPAFRDRFNQALADLPFKAFRWEVPGLTRGSASDRFECVAIDDPGLDRRADPRAFAGHFGPAGGPAVATFANLGGDAILVVPGPDRPGASYAHLAAFVRGAPAPLRDALWAAVGSALDGRLGDRPVWPSTAGAGVAWLHVRLDDRPKYYHHDPYRSAPGR